MKKIIVLLFIVFFSFLSAQKIATPYISTSHSSGINSFDIKDKYLISASTDGTIKVWNMEKRVLIRTFFRHKASIYYMRLIPDTSFVVSIDETNKLYVWDIKTNEILKEYEVKLFKSAISMLKDKNLLIFVKEQNVEILNLKTLKINKLNKNNGFFYGTFPKITRDKKRENLIMGVYPQQIIKIELLSGKTKNVNLKTPHTSLLLSNNGKYLLNQALEKIELYDTNEFNVKKQMNLKTSILTSLAFSPDDKYFAISDGYKVQVYETKTFKKIYEKHLYEQSSKGALKFIDNQSFALGFRDGNINLINFKENKQVEFNTYNKTISKIDISKDGNSLYSSINSKQAFKVNNQTKDYYALTNYLTSEESKLYTKTHDGNITSMFINKNYYIFGTFKGELVLWDINKQKELKRKKIFNSSINSIDFNKNRILLYSQEGELKLLKLKDLKEEFSLKKEEFALRQSKFSKDGKYFFVKHNKGIDVYKTSNQKLVFEKKIKTYSIKDISLINNTLKYVYKDDSKSVLDFETQVIEEDIKSKNKKVLFTLKKEDLTYYTFSNDGNTLVYIKNKKYYSLNLKNKKIKEFKIPFTLALSSKLHFSRDDKTISIVNNDLLYLYSLSTGDLLQKYLLHKVDKEDIHSIFRPFVINVAFSKDSDIFVSNAKKIEVPKYTADYINIWDLEKLLKPKKISASRYTLSINDFDLKDKELTYVSNGSIKNFKKLKSQNEYKSFYGIYNKVQRYKDKYLLFMKNDNSIELVDYKSKKLLHKIKPLSGYFTQAMFSGDGKDIITTSSNFGSEPLRKEKHYTLVAYSTKDVKVSIKNDSYGWKGISYFNLNKNKMILSSRGITGILDIKDIKNFKILKDNPSTKISAFNKNLFAIGTYDGLVKLYDKKAKLIHSFEAHGGSVNSIVFHPSKAFLISSVDDGMVKVWHLKKKELVASFISFDNEWLVLTKEGYFSGSLKAARNLSILSDEMNTFSMDKVYDIFFRPDLVKLKLLDIDISKYIKDINLAEVVKNLAPELSFTKFENKSINKKEFYTSKQKVQLSFKVENENSGIGLINIFHEGKLIQTIGQGKINKIQANLDSSLDQDKKNQEYKEKQKELIASLSKSIDSTLEIEENIQKVQKSNLENEAKEYTIEVELLAGDNTISIQAFNKTNTIASITKSIKIKANLKKKKASLHAIVFGVNEFESKNVKDLKYSQNDASDVKKALEYYGSSLFAEVKIHYLISKDATLEKINEAILKVQQEAKLEDTIVLYMSTHGRSTKNGALYLVPQNNKSFKKWINFEETFKGIQKAKALNQIFVIDACESGQASSIVSSIYDSKVSSMAKKAGVHVLMATTKGTFAFEHPNKAIKNGVFTYSILDSLKQNSTDKNKDGKISIKELSKVLKDSNENLDYQYPVIRNIGNDVKLKDLKKSFN